LSDVALICGRRDKSNLWKLYIHLGIVISFLCGALVTGFTFRALHHKQLFVNFCFYLSIGVLYSLLVKSEREYRWIGRWFRAVTQSSNEREVDEPTIEIIPTAATSTNDQVNSCGTEEDKEEEELALGEEEDGLVDVEVDLSGLSSRRPTHEEITVFDGHLVSEGLHGDEGPLKGDTQPKVEDVETLAPASSSPSPTGSVSQLDLIPPKQQPNPWLYSYTQIGIVLLCLHSGFLNATTAHSSRHLYTTHITGTGTQFAIDISHSGPTQIAVNGGMLVCYFIGSALTGTVVKSDFYSINKSYLRIFIVGTCLLVLALAIHLSYPESYFFYLILAIFSGMQAALGCKIKGVIIRTTFMSGCATDLGASLGKMLRHGFSTGISSIKMLLPSMLAYMTGACIATLLYPVFGRYQIIVNIIAFASIGALHSYVLHFKME
jgi:uncharacterized membrane protein YoaK (UPF0700 family)